MFFFLFCFHKCSYIFSCLFISKYWANPKKNFVAILFPDTRGCRNVEKIVTLFLWSKFIFVAEKCFLENTICFKES